MILLTSEDTLQIALAGVPGSQPILYAAYADHSTSAFTPGCSSGTTNSTTAVDWVAAPAASITRQVKYLSCYNIDSGAVAATVSVSDNGVGRTLLVIELQAGERLEYTDGRGFRVLTDTGAEKPGTAAEATILPIGIACSDETTDLTTGTAKVTFRMPFAFTLSGVRASVTTAPTGAALTVDINEGGVSILSTKLTIDAGEKTSTTAATPAVISDTTLADDAEITIDIDQIGSTVAGAGLKVWLIGTKA